MKQLFFLVCLHVLMTIVIVACEQSLWGTLATWQEKEGELATTSLEFEFHLQFLCGFPSTDPSDFCQSAWRGNECKCKTNIAKHVPRVMTSLLMSSWPISISHWLFRCRYSNSKDVVASSPSFSCSATRAPLRACLQATTNVTSHNKAVYSFLSLKLSVKRI